MIPLGFSSAWHSDALKCCLDKGVNGSEVELVSLLKPCVLKEGYILLEGEEVHCLNHFETVYKSHPCVMTSCYYYLRSKSHSGNK